MAKKTRLEKAETKETQFTPKYSDKLNDAVNDTSVKYKDANTNYDRMYNNYKKSYMTEAQKAKTGIVNYGNSLGGDFAKSVSDQAMQQYMTDRNRLNPTFEKLAYEQYQAQKDDAYNRVAMYSNLEGDRYNRYRDKVSDNRQWRDYLYGDWQDRSNDKYRRYGDKLALDTADKNYEQRKYADEQQMQYQEDVLANERDRADKDYWLNVYRDDVQDEISKAKAAAKASGGGGRIYSGGGRNYYGGNDTDTENTTDQDQVELFREYRNKAWHDPELRDYVREKAEEELQEESNSTPFGIIEKGAEDVLKNLWKGLTG